ncbi:MAG: nucleotidyl transferase AbiEii/AbiGii toxin family protein [Cyanobacteriota bacterium]
MKTMIEKLAVIANTTGHSLEEVVAQHVREAILRRVSDSEYADVMVLRGGMLTKIWVPPGMRNPQDVDFLALYPFDVEGTQQRFHVALAATNIEDGIVFDLDSLQAKAIWEETEFPGVRLSVGASVGEHYHPVQIDIGFGDPLVPPAQWIDYPTLLEGLSIKLQACSPETLVGWKLHGLVELGTKRWRPKDLYDLMLLIHYTVLDASLLLDAIAVAFSSRSTPLEKVLPLLSSPASWDNSRNRSKWQKFRNNNPNQLIPEDLQECVTVVSERLKGVMEALIEQ